MRDGLVAYGKRNETARRKVDCPTCLVKPYFPCEGDGPEGKPRTDGVIHLARWNAYLQTLSTKPVDVKTAIWNARFDVWEAE